MRVWVQAELRKVLVEEGSFQALLPPLEAVQVAKELLAAADSLTPKPDPEVEQRDPGQPAPANGVPEKPKRGKRG